MEKKHILLSALSAGVGVGVGLGLALGENRTVNGISGEQIEQELLRLVIDGNNIEITFDDFPYYLSERTNIMLTSAAHIHLNHLNFRKHSKHLSSASRAILLSGSAEIYMQMLAKALANQFESKLLLLDLTDFSMKMQSKYGCHTKKESFKSSISEMTMTRVSSLISSLSSLQLNEYEIGSSCRKNSGQYTKLRNIKSVNYSPKNFKSQCSSSKSAHLKRISSWAFDENVFVQSLHKVLASFSEKSSIILYIRNVDRFCHRSSKLHKLFDKMLKKLSGSVVVLGSRLGDQYDDDCREVNEKVRLLFPYNIEIRPPKDELRLLRWKAMLKKDMETNQFQDNKNHITEVLAANDLECDDLGSICQADAMVLSNYIEQIVMAAMSYHLMNNKDPEYRNGKLIISSNSLPHGLSIFEEKKGDKQKLEKNAKSSKEVPDNEFETRIRTEIIPSKEIGVSFNDIGALDEIKESLQELVMLPLRRPNLFNGGLLKPCRGVLLFGPPGTGKTMLAKAIAKEAGANFINVSMSTITSTWFGEDEKNVRALFTLAAKVSPSIIFVDEVDSMLGKRTRVGEHEAMHNIKNEFMSHWDGLLTKPCERILVLAATNRPFDLDEAIIRRFERRIMVGLPSKESREKILSTLLSKEKVESLDMKELAAMTEGYSGSDLKNLCTTAAYQPVRELIQQERQNDMEKKQKAEEGQCSKDAANTQEEEERVITLRALNMEDLRRANNQVGASFASDGFIMNELKEWNELYGGGTKKKSQQLTYFF